MIINFSSFFCNAVLFTNSAKRSKDCLESYFSKQKKIIFKVSQIIIHLGRPNLKTCIKNFHVLPNFKCVATFCNLLQDNLLCFITQSSGKCKTFVRKHCLADLVAKQMSQSRDTEIVSLIRNLNSFQKPFWNVSDSSWRLEVQSVLYAGHTWMLRSLQALGQRSQNNRPMSKSADHSAHHPAPPAGCFLPYSL